MNMKEKPEVVTISSTSGKNPVKVRHTDRLWPDFLWHFTVDTDKAMKMNENIEDRLYQLEEDGKSQITSNDGGFHSGNLREEKCLKPLLEDYIPIGLKTIFNDLELDNHCSGDFNVGVWGNINYPNCQNKPHLHPGSHLSGTYYVRHPADSGNLRLYNPNSYHDLEPFQRHLEIYPSPGEFYVWRSDLLHDVGVNRSEEDRISIAFNLYLHPKRP